MDRVDHVDLRVGERQLPDRLHDLPHGLPVVLPPVAGNGNDPAVPKVQLVQLRHGEDEVGANRGFHGVDDRVAGDELRAGHRLLLQVAEVVVN